MGEKVDLARLLISRRTGLIGIKFDA